MSKEKRQRKWAPKPRVVIDGLKEVPKEELHSFIATFHFKKYDSSKYSIHYSAVFVPLQIYRLLKLKNGDKMLVALKKASPQEIEEYTKK